MVLAVKRGVISLLLIVHLSALVLNNMPANPIQETFGGWVPYYLHPTGQWQDWGMFAPEPSTDTFVLKAMVKDARGLLRHYDFPCASDKSAWEGLWLYRHSKYAHNVGTATGKANREFAARTVVRDLNLKAEDFPAVVQLVYEVWPTPRPDEAPGESSTAPWQSVIETYQFPNLAEALP